MTAALLGFGAAGAKYPGGAYWFSKTEGPFSPVGVEPQEMNLISSRFISYRVVKQEFHKIYMLGEKLGAFSG